MFKKHSAWLLIVACAVTAYFIWQPLIAHSGNVLTVSFLDVGQGDAIFIESPTGRQVLIDGGRPDRSVLRELGEVMPWSDRSLDLIIPTHPDADHVGGLIDVLERYETSMVLRSSVEGDTDLWRALLTSFDIERAEIIYATRGQVIDLGGGAYIEILFPDRTVTHIETNTGSVVAQLVYGKTRFLLTGDSPQTVEKYLVALDGKGLESDVLKAGHHGSHTSSSQEFIDAVHPRFAVFSRGCGNTYGHPHEDIVSRFASAGIPTLDTCKDGRASFVSDGETVRIK